MCYALITWYPSSMMNIFLTNRDNAFVSPSHEYMDLPFIVKCQNFMSPLTVLISLSLSLVFALLFYLFLSYVSFSGTVVGLFLCFCLLFNLQFGSINSGIAILSKKKKKKFWNSWLAYSSTILNSLIQVGQMLISSGIACHFTIQDSQTDTLSITFIE